MAHFSTSTSNSVQSSELRISGEERARHDAQFYQLKPVAGYLTGEQAKDFFLQSRLPPPELGQIWTLADINSDGRMDKKEFSIAMYLIKKRLEGREVPRVLPRSLKEDPVPMTMGSFGGAGFNPPPVGGAGFNPSTLTPSVGGFGSLGSLGPSPATLPNGGMTGLSQGPPQVQPSSLGQGSLPPPTVGSEWAVPSASRLRYKQQFNKHDKNKSGKLSGIQARNILFSSGLPQPTLAQIWGLADVDGDGSLTSDEFCLAMHLVDLVRSGRPLPPRLTPDLVPPSMRSLHPSALPAPPQPLGGLGGMMGNPPSQHGGSLPSLVPIQGFPAATPAETEDRKAAMMMMLPVSFEDKKRENFEKGQQELERRRTMLRDEENREKERREHKEKQELERRERERLEQERRRQMEREKWEAKQREVEAEQEEKRRRAIEQREAAKRELERQRQMEWERQKKEELMQRRLKQQEGVCHLKATAKNLDYQLESTAANSAELGLEMGRARAAAALLGQQTHQLAAQRDQKMTELSKLRLQLEEFQQKEEFLEREHGALVDQHHSKGLSNPISENLQTVMFSFNKKKAALHDLRETLLEMEKKMAASTQQITTSEQQMQGTKQQLLQASSQVQQLRVTLQQKHSEFVSLKRRLEEDKKMQGVKVQRELEAVGEQQRQREERERQQQAQAAAAEAKRKQEEEQKKMAAAAAATTTPTSNTGWGDFDNQFDAFGQNSAKMFEETVPAAQGKKDPFADLMGVFKGPSQQPTNNSFPAGQEVKQETGFASDPFASQAPQTATTPDPFSGHASHTTTPDPFSSQAGSSPSPFAMPAFAPTSTSPVVKVEGVGGQPEGFDTYKAVFAFEAQGEDELSIKPGDVIRVAKNQEAEPGWLGGELADGRTGWFPTNYAQRVTPDPSPQPVAATIPANASIEADSADGGKRVGRSSSFTKVVPAWQQGGEPPVGAPQGAGAGQLAPEGLEVQALYPWRAKTDNHLTFNKGDVISVREQQDMWWSGQLNGQTGWFPKSYVKVVAGGVAPGPLRQAPEANSAAAARSDSQTPELAGQGSNPAALSPSPQPVLTSTTPVPTAMAGPSQVAYVALFPYNSTEEGDLSFSVGDIITVTEKEGDWWVGTAGGRTGSFPFNYVKEYQPNDQPQLQPQPPQEQQQLQPQPQQQLQPQQPQPEAEPTTSTDVITTLTKPEIGQVIAAYTAAAEDQLTIELGQLVQVKQKSSGGWWEGELQARGKKRQTGWFPANYIKLLSSAAGTLPRSTSATPEPAATTSLDSAAAAQAAAPTSPSVIPQAAGGGGQVIAIFAYVAQNADELSFAKGSVINLVDKEEESDWWRGEVNGQTGLFPSNYVQPLTELSITESTDAFESLTKKRQNHIHELIDTEQSYADSMSIVQDVFCQPLIEGKALTQDEANSVFVNWKELILCSSKLLKALRVRKKMSGKNIEMIGDIMCEQLPHLTPYIRFCSCQLKASQLIQKKTDYDPNFTAVHKKIISEDKRTYGLPLSSFLLKPMQRITKYPLLIKKILEHTPDDHPDHYNLKEALEKAEELCTQVNEGVRERENCDQLEWLQKHVQFEGLAEKLIFNSLTNCLGSRKFVYSGTLYKVKSNKELRGFLFNDFLLLTQPVRSGLQPFSMLEDKLLVQFKMYKNPIFLNEVKLQPGEPTPEDPQVFHLNHLDTEYGLRTETANERTKWVTKIQAASKNFIETEQKKREQLRQEQAHRSPGVGRLLVAILEGKDLKPCDINGLSDPYCEVSMGGQEHRTKTLTGTLNPQWNSSMQFLIQNLQQDVLCLTVFDRDLFSPNDFMGRTEIRVADITAEMERAGNRNPVIKKLLLHEVETGEITVKIGLQIFDSAKK